jgi:WD40 repeat protein
MIGHTSPISGVDVFADKLVVTAGYDNQVILWDAARRTALARGYHDHLANQCRFSPTGRAVVSASSDYSARVWSVPELHLLSVLGPHDDDVEMATFDPAGERVATACRDGSVRIFAADGSCLCRLAGHEADVLSVEWLTAETLASTGDDGTLRLWDLREARLLQTHNFGLVETDTFAVLPNSADLCIGDDHGQLTWISQGQRRVMKAHEAGVKRVIAAPNGLVLTTSYDRMARLWRVATGSTAPFALAAEIELPAQVWPRSAAFGAAGTLIFGTFGNTYATYGLSTATWDLEALELSGGINAIWADDAGVYTVGDAGLVRDRRDIVGRVGSLCNFIISVPERLVIGGQTGQLFDARSGEVLHRHHAPLNCAVTFRCGQGVRLVVGAYTGDALVFDVTAGALTHIATVQLHDNAIKGLASNGTHLFSVCATGAAAFHTLPDLACVRTINRAHTKIANGAAAINDGRFVSVGRDLMLRIWSLGGSSAVCTPHDHSVKCVTASRDGRWVATGSYDGQVAVYDLSHQKWVVHERPTASGISSITQGCTPGTFLAGSYDGLVYEVSLP